jgi:hypothetical protein
VFGEIWCRERAHQLPCSISTEVRMDHHIGWGETHYCRIAQRHPRWQNEFIALSTRIRLLQGQLWAAGETIAGEDDALERGCGALPTGVAIHAVVATTDGCDLCGGRCLTHALLERGESRRCGSRRRIAAVEEQVHQDSGDACSVCGTKHLNRMAVIGMDATVAKERDHVQAALLRCGEGAVQAGHRREGAAGNRRINAREVLRYALTAPNVEVSNFAIPHLASRKPNSFAARSKRRVGVLRTERTPVGH